MHPPFFVPAQRAEPPRPRPAGTRHIVIRSKPEVLRLAIAAQDALAIAPLRPVKAPCSKPLTLRQRVGLALIHAGHALAGELSVVKENGPG